MYRALATANAFMAAGWDVTVLTATRDAFDRLTGTDELSEAQIDPRIEVVRAPFDVSRGEPDLAKWSRSRVESALWWSYSKALRERLAFPEPGYGSWRAPLIAATRKIHAAKPVSLVIGTANPNVDFVPGEYLHAKHRVPYVTDYRDTWHLDMYSGKRIGSKSSRSARRERRLLAGASEAWFVNEPIRNWHATEYPENAANFHVVSNGFDPGFLDARRNKVVDGSAGLVFGYLGTIYGPMPLRETFEGWRIARQESDLVRRSTLVIRGRLGHYVAANIDILALLEEFSGDGITYAGPVSKTGVAEVYRGFDALLLILGKSRYITSGKVFEYAATGLPIASLHDVETAATSVLTGYPFWFPTPDLKPSSIASTIIETGIRAAEMSTSDFETGSGWAEHLSRERQLAPRIAALTALVGGTS
jgi:glycosyltransferase involved in cell wall biosynthesis